MNCVEVEKYFADLLDNSLGHERLREIKSHLAACSRCSEELAALAECQRLVSGLPPVEPPVGFTNRVMAEVRDAAHRPNFWERLFLPLQIKLPLQATAVVLISVLAAYIYQKESRQREPATSKVQVPDEAGTQGARLKSSAQPEEPRSLAEPEEQNKRIDGVRPRGPATAPSEDPSRSPAPSPLQKQSLTASEAAFPRREQASPSIEAHAPPASAAVPQFDKDASLNDAVAGNLSSSSAPREKRASTSLDTLKSGRAVAAFPAGHEFTLRLKGPARGDQTTAASSELERPQAQPQPSAPQSEYKDLDQARQRAIKTGQPQTVWVTIGASQYDAFKKELAGLGSIESESPAPARKNDAKFADQLPIKVTILPPLSSAEPPSSR